MKIKTLQKICRKYNLKQHVSLNEDYKFYIDGFNLYLIEWKNDLFPVYGILPDGICVNKESNELDYDGNECKYSYPYIMTTAKEVEQYIVDTLARLKALTKEVRMNRIKEL